jgi:hypothetical protein
VEYVLSLLLSMACVGTLTSIHPAVAALAGCGYGYQWPDQGQGWDIAALSDQHPEYRGSCGGCYEIKCQSSDIRDGYGE